MYLILRLIQKLVGALNSDGTPGQVGAGLAIGTVFGLTPLVNVHNVVLLSIVAVTKVSLPGAVLGWLATVPLGFMLDPWFDALGQRVLDLPALTAFWTTVTNTPLLALTNLNNSVVLGSLIVWVLALGPLYLLARWGVARYRATLFVRLQKTKLYQAVRASKVFNLYRLFRPT